MESEEVFKNKLHQAAHSVSERVTILDARDKLLRMRRTRQTNLATAVAVVGTCTDMCPEFERYFREDTNQVVSLEMKKDSQGNTVVDHDAMVKEYRRSGADQEEPLPHELRPPVILNRTMDYLCTNIMDRCENAGEWFDFVWSRTRAIRKDITQQYLRDLNAVSLTEKCARFHIFCSLALCEEDVKDFDPKINNENLLNCLQSLKEFYYDLSLHNISCPNEAEFRCYDMLLHLKDGDIVREVKNYKKNIRQSPQVKFAIEAFHVLQSNNFVQLFEMLRQTTYLNACLMHRYLNEVRINAFRVFRRAYTSKVNVSEAFPIQEIVYKFGFESKNEVQDFCNRIGLESNENSVILTRGFNSEVVIKPMKEKLIEMKRKCLVGEVVNGGPLPPNPYKIYPLHNSFNESGQLKDEAVGAVDQQARSSTILKAKKLFASANVIPTTLEKEETVFKGFPFRSVAIEKVQETARFPTEPEDKTTLFEIQKKQEEAQIQELLCSDIFNTLIDQITKNFVGDFLSDQTVSLIFFRTIDKAIEEIVREASAEVLTQVKMEKAREEKEKRENLERIECISRDLTDEIILSVVYKEVLKKAESVVLEEKQNLISKLSLDLAKETLNSVVSSCVYSIASETFQQAIEERDEKVKIIKKKREMKLQEKYFLKWRYFCLKRRRFAYLRRTFPAAPTYVELRNEPNKHQSMDIEHDIQKAKRNISLGFLKFKLAKSKNSPQKILRLQNKYFNKWKSIWLKNRKSNKLSKSFPAAPKIHVDETRLDRNKIPFLSTDICIEEANFRINEAFELRRRKSLKRNLEETKVTDQTDNSKRKKEMPHFYRVLGELSKELSKEKEESEAFTKKLNEVLNPLSSSPSSSFQHSTLQNSSNLTSQLTILIDDSEDEDPNSQILVLEESPQDKMKRIERIIEEEKSANCSYNSTLSTLLVTIGSEDEEDLICID